MKFCINIATNDRKLFVSRQLLCFRDQSSLPNVGFVHTLYSSNFKEFELNGTNWLAGSSPAMMEMPRNARRALRPSLNFDALELSWACPLPWKGAEQGAQLWTRGSCAETRGRINKDACDPNLPLKPSS